MISLSLQTYQLDGTAEMTTLLSALICNNVSQPITNRTETIVQVHLIPSHRMCFREHLKIESRRTAFSTLRYS